MAVTFDEQRQLFKLDTERSSYAFFINYLGAPVHLYYGPRIQSTDLTYLNVHHDRAFSPGGHDTLDTIPQEYSTYGVGDYRVPSAIVENTDGHAVTRMTYQGHKITVGKPALSGLPATFGQESEVMTLELSLIDTVSRAEFILLYSVFEKHDAIARSVRVVNHSSRPLFLNKVSSMTLDFFEGNLDLVHLWGAWGRERYMERTPLIHGIQTLSSARGLSSHQHNPFFAMAETDTTETSGRAYGVALLYSGNFEASIELDQFEQVRTQIGINPDGFRWKLEPDGEFQAPETVMVFSNSGFGSMSRKFHDLFRNNLMRSYWKDKKRPILVNNWEATYFNFNTEKLLSIAKDAKQLGIEMLVLDDGWFGKRDCDNCSLGDWFVYESKLPGGLTRLVDEINKMGLKFGLWFEPEMVSPDSKLYEAHPDWCLHVPNRPRTEGRQQLVLDMSRPEVVDYLFETICGVLDSANIEYIKWDANRHLTEVGSAALPGDRQGEVFHRYVLGMYELHERLIRRYPKLLIEGCSGGGGRFDAGMLFYVPQIWTSDDSDAMERLRIQQGTSMVYPCSAMGAHVSDCPNHQTGRVSSFATRGDVALAGTFGYELDLNKMSEEVRDLIRKQVEMYHKYNPLIAQGDLYRLTDSFSNLFYAAWMNVSKDRRECLLTYVCQRRKPNGPLCRIRLQGLNPAAKYQEEESGVVYDGDVLMNAGFNVPDSYTDATGHLFHFKAV